MPFCLISYCFVITTMLSSTKPTPRTMLPIPIPALSESNATPPPTNTRPRIRRKTPPPLERRFLTITGPRPLGGAVVFGMPDSRLRVEGLDGPDSHSDHNSANESRLPFHRLSNVAHRVAPGWSVADHSGRRKP